MTTPFDIQRAMFYDKHETPPLYTSRTTSLKTALATGILIPSMPALTFEHQQTTYVFSTLQLTFYHVVQLELASPLMVTFCVVCNAGMCFSPILDETSYHFASCGLYNAMTLLTDDETDSIWNHLTGECLYGAMQGKQLKSVGSPRHTTMGQILASQPEAELVIGSLSEIQESEARDQRQRFSPPQAGYTDLLTPMLVQEDTRLPRLEPGLGIRSASVQRYYPYRVLNAHNNFVFDELNAQRLLVYIDAQSGTPASIYTTATDAEWHGDTLRLNNQTIIRDGTVYDAQGSQISVSYPHQLFARWYSFAVTFPGCEIYQG